MNYTLVAPCYFGTEASASFDFKRIGAKDIAVTDGRVTFTGDENIIAAANINSRCAERICILLKKYKAETFDELFDGVHAIAWEDLLPPDAQFPVKGASLSSTLSSVPACQSIVKKAIVERLKKGHKTQMLPETGAIYKIRFAIRKDVAEIMLDTSGAGLHKRGYRKNATMAPIKETLAAAMLDQGRLYYDSVTQDPFCGSGTLMIEAAMKATHMAPGLRRRFGAEQYSFIAPSIWQQAREQALAEIQKDCEFKAYGFDIDPEAVALANQNAKLAGVDKYCSFHVADVRKFAPAEKSLVFTNPPYGERLGNLEEATMLEKILGEQLQKNPVRSAYIITADADFEQNFGKKAVRRRKIYNGMIPCQIYMYY